MSAVIICDDLAFSANAAATLKRVGQQDQVNIRWKTIFWPMNALNEKDLAEKALIDSLDAHLILFPARCAQALPHWVLDWLDSWAKLRTIREAALGVMADERVAEFSKLTPLLRLAHLHDLTVLVDPQRPPERAQGFVEAAPRPDFRHSGINE